MARPKKQTIDYFPHYVSDGKTKLILQNEFGNDGYAFWYQLLELLCESENQVYDYSNPASLRLLLAKTHSTEDIAVKILQLLADLGTIDLELHKRKIIWSQNLIENLELVYKRRSTGTPEKPVIVNNNAVNVSKKPQTKLNNTKLNNTIYILPDWIDKKTWDDFLEMRKKNRVISTDRAKELIIKKLEKLKAEGNNPNEVLEQSIVNNWKGVFPLKGGQGGAYKGHSREIKPRETYTKPDQHRKAG